MAKQGNEQSVAASLSISLTANDSMRRINEDPAGFGIKSRITNQALSPQIRQDVAILRDFLFVGEVAADFVHHELFFVLNDPLKRLRKSRRRAL